MSAIRAYPTGYPITAVVTARQLRAGGETFPQIAEFIGEQYGAQPSIDTVRGWCSKRVADRARKRNLQRKRARAALGGTTGGRLGNSAHTPEFRLARMVALRSEGMSDVAIAAVMSFDYRAPVTAMEVGGLLAEDVRRSWKGRARTMLSAAPDLSTAEVARRVGVSVSSVQKFRAREGL